LVLHYIYTILTQVMMKRESEVMEICVCVVI